MLEKLLAALSEAFGLTREQRQLLIRVLWVLAVTTHIAWICGLLAAVGFNTPFVRAEQLAEVRQETARLKDEVSQLREASELSTRLGIVREIRIQTAALCSAADAPTREAIQSTIDRLRLDYYALTKEHLSEQRCSA